MRVQPSRTYNPGNTRPEGETMRLRLRRRNEAPPLERPGLFARVPLTPEVADWLVARDASGGASESAQAIPVLPPPLPPPPAITANGLRAQATPTDARAERLVRGLRMELEDIKQTIAAHDEDREGLIGVDLEAVRADPRAAAALPPATLARALAAAADRIAALEREIVSHERENTVLRDQQVDFRVALRRFTAQAGDLTGESGRPRTRGEGASVAH